MHLSRVKAVARLGGGDLRAAVHNGRKQIRIGPGGGSSRTLHAGHQHVLHLIFFKYRRHTADMVLVGVGCNHPIELSDAVRIQIIENRLRGGRRACVHKHCLASCREQDGIPLAHIDHAERKVAVVHHRAGLLRRTEQALKRRKPVRSDEDSSRNDCREQNHGDEGD